MEGDIRVDDDPVRDVRGHGREVGDGSEVVLADDCSAPRPSAGASDSKVVLHSPFCTFPLAVLRQKVSTPCPAGFCRMVIREGSIVEAAEGVENRGGHPKKHQHNFGVFEQQMSQ